MDFGASFHATHSSEALQNLVIGDFGKVRLPDNKTLDVTGMSDIVLKTLVDFWTLKDVRGVPSLTKSLISVRHLDEHEHDVEVRKSTVKGCQGKSYHGPRKKERFTVYGRITV